ncbi:MAG TPA: hypothetical protein VGQ46_05270 [Thermoanaerobaculia bacterium]|jgi:hypothetical protein|nr:hypothetical protein [Thermoanaerobaculia bacterium]
MNARVLAAAFPLALTVVLAAQPASSPPPCPYAHTPTASPNCHPYPQPLPAASSVTTKGDTTYVRTGESLFPPPTVDPFTLPPGTNFLPTIYTNMYDHLGNEMPNTLPSTPNIPYNLHDGDPIVTEIDPTSASDDLLASLNKVAALTSGKKSSTEVPAVDSEEIRKAIQIGLDVLEGNPRPGRMYSGLPLLHYLGPTKIKPVVAIKNAAGIVMGGNVDIHQVWYDGHIESDTSFIDPTAVLDVPWTVTYTVDILNRGEDDFSPFVIYVDPTLDKNKNMEPVPHIGMDQTFFPMATGTRTVLKIKNAPARYLNMTYTWGWRNHPPRIQVTENARKSVKIAGQPKHSLPDWERLVFCPKEKQRCIPNETKELKERAIGMLGELAPEKQMWMSLREARTAAERGDYPAVAASIHDALASFDDFRDRTRLPRTGKHPVKADPDSDLTLLYVNNTIYAEFTDRSETIDDSQRIDFDRWKMRGTTLRVTIYNGDHFEHGYENVDFGGSRGWENQFKSSVSIGGSGCWFTFGRAHWWPNIPNQNKTVANPQGELTVVVPAALGPYAYSVHKVQIDYNYEPSRRLRFYQFDPLHHDVAIFSVH